MEGDCHDSPSIGEKHYGCFFGGGVFQSVDHSSQVSLLVNVRDDLGRPISNAVVSVKTLNRLATGYGTRPSHFLWASNRTDETGTTMVCFDCLTADFACYVSSENHYPEKNLKGRYLARENSSLGMDILSPVTKKGQRFHGYMVF